MEDLRAKLMNVPDQERVWEQFVANTSANLVLPLKIHSTPLMGEVMTRYIVVVATGRPGSCGKRVRTGRVEVVF